MHDILKLFLQVEILSFNSYVHSFIRELCHLGSSNCFSGTILQTGDIGGEKGI